MISWEGECIKAIESLEELLREKLYYSEKYENVLLWLKEF